VSDNCQQDNYEKRILAVPPSDKAHAMTSVMLNGNKNCVIDILLLITENYRSGEYRRRRVDIRGMEFTNRKTTE